MKIGKNIKTINICFATDDIYAIHCAVALASVLENSSHDNYYNFYILDGGISRENKMKISSLMNIGNCKIQFLSIDKKMFKDSFLDYYFTEVIYYRFLIPELINVDRVIYLDSDVIARKDISAFFNTKIANYYIAAIEDILPLEQVQRMNAAGLEIKSGHYYNSGVLLINCDKWRKEKITKSLISCMAKNKKKLLWPDQDILNYFLQRKIKPVDPIWNFQLSRHRKTKVTEKEIDNAAILHFVTDDKPWNVGSKQPHREEYFKYLSVVNKAEAD